MIVVFGSLNLDLVMAVEALPRPGETVLSAGYQAVPGGKGANQAVAARRAGAQVRMYGMLGDDDFGRRVRESLESAGVDGAGVSTAADPTGCAAVCVDEAGENQIAAASGANLAALETRQPRVLVGLRESHSASRKNLARVPLALNMINGQGATPLRASLMGFWLLRNMHKSPAGS